MIELDYDAAGHQVTRREHRGTSKPRVSSFRYVGDEVVEHTLDGAIFRSELDSAGHPIVETISRTDGTHQHPTWRGEYKNDRLVASQDMRTVGYGADAHDVPGSREDYEYDRYGRVTRSIATLSIGGSVTIAYEYDDSMECRRYRDPEEATTQRLNIPCPTTITTVDAQGRRVSRPTYRNGRLMQDDNYAYVYDTSGRLERMSSLRVHDGSGDHVLSYTCSNS